jgi:hypothetical protein
MLAALQLKALPALVPLKVTMLAPWLAPKLLPPMVTILPTGVTLSDRPKPHHDVKPSTHHPVYFATGASAGGRHPADILT